MVLTDVARHTRLYFTQDHVAAADCSTVQHPSSLHPGIQDLKSHEALAPCSVCGKNF
jgi:hypothetical protein